MATHSRRDFLKFSAGLAGATAATALLPESIRKALAIEPNSVTGTIQDVQHIVVFMQENRSFDHYLGHLSGVRGYNDRFLSRCRTASRCGSSRGRRTRRA